MQQSPPRCMRFMDKNSINLQRLKIANRVMFVCIVMTLVLITLVYGYERYLSLTQQIVGHISIMILPAIFKVSYVVRLTCLRALNLND